MKKTVDKTRAAIEENAACAPTAISRTLATLEQLRADPSWERIEEYFGPSFALRLSVLIHMQSDHAPITQIAWLYGVSKQAVSKHRIKALRIFGIPSTGG
jgi:hypothetical protein